MAEEEELRIELEQLRLSMRSLVKRMTELEEKYELDMNKAQKQIESVNSRLTDLCFDKI